MRRLSPRLEMLCVCCLVGWGCEGRTEEPADRSATPRSTPELELATVPLRTLLDSARSLYEVGEYTSADSVWQTTLERARAVRDSAAEAESITWSAYVAWQLAEYQDARQLGEQALDLKLRYGLTDQLPRSYNQLGLVAWYQGRLTDAAELFQQAAETGRALDVNHTVIAVAGGNLGLIHTDLGNFDAAREGFALLRDVGRGLGNARYEGNGFSNLGMLDIATGDPLSAVSNLHRALELYRPIDFVNGQQVALGQLALAYTDLGEPRLAFAALDTALQLSRRLGQRDEEARNLEQLAVLHHEAGNLKHALDLYDRARRIYEQVGLDLETGTNLRNVAALHVVLGDFESARREATRALELHRGIGDKFEELHDLNMLAEIEHRAGRTEQAEEYVGRARMLARELEASSIRIAVALQEARMADRDRLSRRVLDILRRVEDDLDRAGPAAKSEGLMLKARAHARLNQFELAAAVGRRGVEAVEQVRSRYGSGKLRTSYAVQRVEVYGGLVSALLRLGSTAEAFAVADAARGRALVEHLAVARTDAGRDKGSTFAEAERLLRRIDQLLATLTDMQSWPDEERSPETEARLDERLRQARAQHQALLVTAQEQDKPTAALLGARGAVLADVQRVLGAREALVELLVTQERVWIFVVRRNQAQAFGTDIAEERLASRVRVARGFLGDPETSDELMRTVLQGLHTVLARPALDAGILSDVNRLIVVPHAVLNYVPFAVLQDGVTGKYLVEDYELQYLPTAAALPVLRDGRSRPSATSGRATLFAPLASSLPATREETRAIRRALAGAEERIDGRATEASFRQALTRGDIVHAATHGILNVRNPMFSRIELARGSGNGSSDDDGRLEIHELFELSIASPLVFLSGCETGAGAAGWTQFAKGEDYATLAQAFLYAGTPNVVATLWRIDDEGAARFAEHFYRRLGSANATTALAEAQRQMMQDPVYGAPYYWAGYRLTGSGTIR